MSMVLLRIVAAVCTGAAQALVAPPVGWSFLHWVSWVPLLWAISGVSWKGRLALGWLSGFAGVLALFSWMVETGQRFFDLSPAGASLLLVLMGLLWGGYVAVFAVLLPRIQSAAGPAWPFAAAALWVACEFLNPQIFPYYQGSAHYHHVLVFQAASLFGVQAVSFLVLLVNGILWAALETLWLRRGPLRPVQIIGPVMAAAVVFTACLGYGAHRLERIDQMEARADHLRIGLVQLGMGVEDRERRIKTASPGIIRDYLAATRDAADRGAQVVVWPEAAFIRGVTGRSGEPVRQLAKDSGIEIWAGAIVVGHDPSGVAPQFHNSAYRIDGTGSLDRRYDKNILLPFSEYTPGVRQFPWLSGLLATRGDCSRGEQLRVYQTPWVHYNFLICYEAIRSRLVRRNVREGSRLLVTLSNDAWFGDTSCPHQHMMLAAARSAEHGCPMVRVATTGISAVVDARGRIVERTEPFVTETLVVDLPLVYAPTLFTRIGNVFPWACVAVTGFGLLISISRRHVSFFPSPCTPYQNGRFTASHER